MRSDLRVVMVLLLVSLLVGCAAMSRKFTFMRPDLTHREFTRTAPEYTFKADRRTTSSAHERLMLAGQRLQAGQLDEAEKQARAALKAQPDSVDANTILAAVADQRGQAGQAGGYFAKAAELAPNRGEVLNNYGVWLCGNGRALESLSWFDRALSDPAYAGAANARVNAGACAADAGQLQRAERDLRMALAQQPENSLALAAMARAKYAMGQYLEARAFSERRLAAAPATAEVLRLASQIEHKLGDNQAAARYEQQVAVQFPPGTAQRGATGNSTDIQ